MADAGAEAGGLSVCAERDASGAPQLAPDESVSLTQPAVSLLLEDAPATPPGTLYVTTRRLVWFPDTPVGAPGYAVPFRSIILHAVSRAAADATQRPCILAQLEGGTPGAAGGEQEEEDEEASTALRLVPADEAALDAIFRAMCDSAALNPDPDSAGEGDDEFFCDVDEAAAGAGGDGARAAALERFDAMLQIDPSRFEDDEEDEEWDEEAEEADAGAAGMQG